MKDFFIVAFHKGTGTEDGRYFYSKPVAKIKDNKLSEIVLDDPENFTRYVNLIILICFSIFTQSI